MTKVMLELSKGDWVVHNNLGLGQITGIETKELMGDQKLFYTVKTEALTYWLPVVESSSERIRPLATAEKFAEALETAASEPKPMEENFRRRLAYIHAQIQDRSLLAKAALIRDLYARNLQKDIHINERRILDTLSEQFINEWIAACGISDSEARGKLRKALKESAINLKPKKLPF